MSSQGLRKHLFSRKSNLLTDGIEEGGFLTVAVQVGAAAEWPTRLGHPLLRPGENQTYERTIKGFKSGSFTL